MRACFIASAGTSSTRYGEILFPDTGSAKALKEGFSVPRDRRPRRKFTSQISESEARFVDAVKTTPVTL